MVQFLKDSDTFCGISFSGMYNIDLDDFEVLYSHYRETGENLLDAYTDSMHLRWPENGMPEIITEDEYSERISKISKLRRLRLIDSESFHAIQSKLKGYLESLHKEKVNKKDRVRKRANSYTSKANVRDWVFTAYGEYCLCCGSNDDIQLDHIVPISKGGKNTLSNLQPLCKSCNVSKGTKTIDYRGK